MRFSLPLPSSLLKLPNLPLFATSYKHPLSLPFENKTNACAVCFCLGFLRPFASDTSPKRIDREGLGESRTGTRQSKLSISRLQYCRNIMLNLNSSSRKVCYVVGIMHLLFIASDFSLSLIGSLSSDDGNGNENVTWKYKFISFVLLRDYFNSLNF